MKYEVQFTKKYANKESGDKAIYSSDLARDLVNMGVAVYSNKTKQAESDAQKKTAEPKAPAKAKAKK